MLISLEYNETFHTLFQVIHCLHNYQGPARTVKYISDSGKLKHSIKLGRLQRGLILHNGMHQFEWVNML